MRYKVYLGDNVYAVTDGYNIVLTTGYGAGADPTNTIYLNCKMLKILSEYVSKVNAQPAGGTPSWPI